MKLALGMGRVRANAISRMHSGMYSRPEALDAIKKAEDRLMAYLNQIGKTI